MELYLLDLIDPRNSDLVCEGDLDRILTNHLDHLTRIPECSVPLVMGRSSNADIYIPHPNRRFREDKLTRSGVQRVTFSTAHIENAVWESLSREHCLINNLSKYKNDIDLGSTDGLRKHSLTNDLNNYPSVIDLGSTNGTFVNGQSAYQTGGVLFNDGDRLCLGPYCFKVIFPNQYRGLKNRSDFPHDSNDILISSNHNSSRSDIPTNPLPIISLPLTQGYNLPPTMDYVPQTLN